MADSPAVDVAVLSLGSNLGDRHLALQRAATLLVGTGDLSLAAASSIYETPPLGVGPEHGPFLNQVLIIRTALSPPELLAICRQVEQELGRPGVRSGDPRTIDIDVITCGSDVLDDDDLQLPHPRYRLRRFVLAPLKEAWPDFRDPRDGAHVDELLEQCPDNSVLRRLIEDKAAK